MSKISVNNTQETTSGIHRKKKTLIDIIKPSVNYDYLGSFLEFGLGFLGGDILSIETR